MTERQTQRAILNWLGAQPWCRLWRQNVGVFVAVSGSLPRPGQDLYVPAGGWRIVKTGVAGAADLTGILAPDGRRLEVEVKSKRGRQTAGQRTFQRMIEGTGGVYVVARSLEDLQQRLHDSGFVCANQPPS